MRLSIFDSVRELDPPPRRFLFFLVFNVISWQCVMGPAMVLLARSIDMPASWVGWLLSFMPLSMLLVVFTVPLVTKLGPKRLMFTTWLGRNLIMSIVFTMPWVMGRWGNVAGWYVLLLATLGFCLFRAMGGAGWLPWLREMVPEEQRATYFSAEATVTQAVSVVLGLSVAYILRGSPGLGPFLLVYAMGVAGGLTSLLWMLRVPGGKPDNRSEDLRGSFAQYGLVLRDRPYLIYVATITFALCSMTWYNAAIVMFMRDILGLAQGTILVSTTVGGVGVMFTVRHWGKFAEHSGNRRALFKTATGQGLAMMAGLLVVPGTPWMLVVLLPSLVMAAVWGVAFWIIAHRTMLGYVPDEGRVAYTNVWTIGSALSLGITPIAVGGLVEHYGMPGYQLCFMLAGLGGCIAAVLCLWSVRDDLPNAPLDRGVYLTTPIRTLGRIVWITLGMHESNRSPRNGVTSPSAPAQSSAPVSSARTER